MLGVKTRVIISYPVLGGVFFPLLLCPPDGIYSILVSHVN